ncbi:MAG TPA: 3-isopropylmalate dehydratase [Candidatus Atribacteria bacterium]|nr:3-isopropylmalate dehydratase [Candidatus Atribacteria bacterium]
MIKGKVFKVGNDIDTDQIFPGRYLYLTSPEEVAVHAMEDAIPDFYKKIEGEDWVIAAGKNFGCGSSREQAPRAILYAGIKAVVAESFGRIFYRNAVNVGLSVIKYPDIFKEVNQSDSIKINLQDGFIVLYNPERKIPIEKYPAQLLTILKSGGLIPYLKKYGKYAHFIDKL